MLSQTKHLCSSINHKTREAKYYCNECKKFFCEECNTSFHSSFFTDHTLVPSSNAPGSGKCSPAVNKCRFHPKYDLDCYCPTHCEVCCAQCYIEDNGKHHKCNVCSLLSLNREASQGYLADAADALARGIDYVDESFANSIDSNHSVVEGELVRRLEAKREALESAINNTKEKTVAAFSRLKEFIAEKEEKALSDLEALKDSLDLSPLINALSDTDGRKAALENAMNVLGDKQGASNYGIVLALFDAKREIRRMEKVIAAADYALHTKVDVEFSFNEDVFINALKSEKVFSHTKVTLPEAWTLITGNRGSSCYRNEITGQETHLAPPYEVLTDNWVHYACLGPNKTYFVYYNTATGWMEEWPDRVSGYSRLNRILPDGWVELYYNQGPGCHMYKNVETGQCANCRPPRDELPEGWTYNYLEEYGSFCCVNKETGTVVGSASEIPGRNFWWQD